MPGNQDGGDQRIRACVNIDRIHCPNLEQGTIKAAALDTFEEEPLPKNNQLWSAKNIFITPHIGGPIPHYYHLLTEIFIDNLKRYLDGNRL